MCVWTSLCLDTIHHNILGVPIFGQTQQAIASDQLDPKSMRPSHKSESPRWGQLA